MSGFRIPIPGLGQDFVIPSVPSFDCGYGGSTTIKSPKRLKRQAEKKRKKLHRKQGRH